MRFEHLIVSLDGSILRVTIDRPDKRNALSSEVLAELARAFSQQATNEQVKLAILTGAGEHNFAAGGDLKKLADVRSEAQTHDMVKGAREALDSIRRFPVPVVAALNGDALGGGAELAVACDFIVARHGARIGFIQGRLNISTAWGGGIRLLERVGVARGLRLLCRSELVGGEDALAIGLVDAVAADGETLEEALQAFCEPILRQTRRVLGAFKELARAHGDGQPRAALDVIEVRRFVEAWLHDDHWQAADTVLSARRTK
jgi:enoyl-CoA hydratase